MDLEGWLRILGLEQYKGAYRDNAIDHTVLPALSLSIETIKSAVGDNTAIEGVIVALRSGPDDGLIVLPDTFLADIGR